MLQYLEQRGAPRATAARACGLEPHAAAGADACVPGSAVERLWEFAQRTTGDRLVGLHMAEAYSPGALDILGYVILSCGTVGDVLKRVSRYAPLLNDGMRIDVVRDRAVVYCRIAVVESMDNYLSRSPWQAVDTTWAGLARELRRLTAKPLAASEVWLRRPRPSLADAAEYRRVLGARVVFDAPEDRFIMPLGHLAEPVLSANRALLQSFEQHAEASLAGMTESSSRSRQVAAVLARRLKGEVPLLEAVARELDMSDRTLQRLLREDGTTYQRLLDEVRRDLAIRHLANPSSSANQIGFLLGFSEPSAFHRAFRRWTGTTPGAYRSA